MKERLKIILQKTKHIRELITSIFEADFKGNISDIEKCDVIFFCHDVDRPISVGGKAFSPLVDSVKKDFESRGFTCISIAHPWSSLTGDRGYGAPTSINKAYLLYKIREKISYTLGLSRIVEDDIYSTILKKTKAKLIITIGSPAGLARAARRRKIFHVELLHAVGYCFIPWNWDTLPTECLPQGILSLDQVSTTSFSKLEEKNTRIHTIPHPFLKHFINKKHQDFDDSFDFLNQIKKNKNKKEIVVTFNWSKTKEDILRKSITRTVVGGFFKKISELIVEYPDIFWHVRLHPVQIRKPGYQYLRDYMDDFISNNSNANWRESSQVPLPFLADICDAHISMESMSCYDVAMLGVPSLMVSPRIQNGGVYSQKFYDLEREGYVTKARLDKYVIREWIEVATKLEPRLSNLRDEFAWEDAVEWMLNSSGQATPCRGRRL